MKQLNPEQYLPERKVILSLQQNRKRTTRDTTMMTERMATTIQGVVGPEGVNKKD